VSDWTRLPKPAEYGLDGEFASEADRRAAVARYEADWYLTRAILRDGELNAAESDARFEVIAERIYERAGLRSP
jgi:hypothetical protein